LYWKGIGVEIVDILLTRFVLKMNQRLEELREMRFLVRVPRPV